MTIHPRELWLIASTSVVAYSYLIANTFPHTFMGLSGLLTSVAHIPLAFTLPCVFSIKLLVRGRGTVVLVVGLPLLLLLRSVRCLWWVRAAELGAPLPCSPTTCRRWSTPWPRGSFL